ncbi:hypothetical protein ACS5NO_14190 [Larkinella sp. GY13]|uniref:hypothetical protein n=1 Tax=Larkinella sp. GY13 TaxID=3453720 RepID=UPI003EE869FB
MNKSQKDKAVLKQTPLTEQEIDRLENYPKAERVNLATLIAKRRRQAETVAKTA